MGDAYPELKSQQQLIQRVIKEEEASFLRTLETGMKLIDQIMQKTKKEGKSVVSGKEAFELYDTFGFPLDLTELILRENNLSLNNAEFTSEMEAQKNRSRMAAVVDTEDWITIADADTSEFVGYDKTEIQTNITRYRKVTSKGKTLYHLVLKITPFYAESGGQVGDQGWLETANEKIEITDTIKENNLFIHIVEKLPSNLETTFIAHVNTDKRQQIQNNHTATHLMHKALRDILGTHVEQKGSLVASDYLRFDFSHFQKMTPEEIQTVEHIVNTKIRENAILEEKRNYPIEEAKKLGAMMLFGEKYGESVRVIKFGDSIELCGGTHVQSTGNIGFFKINSEGAIAAGIRRIEAITGPKVEEYFNEQLGILHKIKELLKNPADVVKQVENIIWANEAFQGERDVLLKEKNYEEAKKLTGKSLTIGGLNFIAEKVLVHSTQDIKDIAYLLRDKIKIENLCLVLGAEIDGKANLVVMISDNLIKEKNLNAGNIIREISKEIDGGGGGQPFFATAGGKKPKGIEAAFARAKALIAG